MRSVPLSQAKTRLPALIKSLQGKRRGLKITKDGKTAALLVSVEEYEGWKDTAEILADPDMMRQIRASQRKGAKFRTYTDKELDELFKA